MWEDTVCLDLVSWWEPCNLCSATSVSVSSNGTLEKSKSHNSYSHCVRILPYYFIFFKAIVISVCTCSFYFYYFVTSRVLNLFLNLEWFQFYSAPYLCVTADSPFLYLSKLVWFSLSSSVNLLRNARARWFGCILITSSWFTNFLFFLKGVSNYI